MGDDRVVPQRDVDLLVIDHRRPDDILAAIRPVVAAIPVVRVEMVVGAAEVQLAAHGRERERQRADSFDPSDRAGRALEGDQREVGQAHVQVRSVDGEQFAADVGAKCLLPQDRAVRRPGTDGAAVGGQRARAVRDERHERRVERSNPSLLARCLFQRVHLSRRRDIDLFAGYGDRQIRRQRDLPHRGSIGHGACFDAGFVVTHEHALGTGRDGQLSWRTDRVIPLPFEDFFRRSRRRRRRRLRGRILRGDGCQQARAQCETASDRDRDGAHGL